MDQLARVLAAWPVMDQDAFDLLIRHCAREVVALSAMRGIDGAEERTELTHEVLFDAVVAMKETPRQCMKASELATTIRRSANRHTQKLRRRRKRVRNWPVPETLAAPHHAPVDQRAVGKASVDLIKQALNNLSLINETHGSQMEQFIFGAGGAAPHSRVRASFVAHLKQQCEAVAPDNDDHSRVLAARLVLDMLQSRNSGSDILQRYLDAIIALDKHPE